MLATVKNKSFVKLSVAIITILASSLISARSFAGEGGNGPDLKGMAISVVMERGVKLEQVKKAVNTSGPTSARSFAGDGRNGPDLEGMAIPVAMERGVKLEQVKKAVSTCLSSGDKQRGLVPVMERLFQQMWNPNEDKLQQIGIPVEFANDGRNVDQKQIHFMEASGHGLRVGALDQLKLSDTYPLQSFLNISIDISGSKLYSARLTSDNIFPYVKWTKIVSQPTYDSLGSVIFDDMIAQGVTITVPANYGRGGEVLQFTNIDTKQKTSVRLNVREYVECLQAEIQRNAN